MRSREGFTELEAMRRECEGGEWRAGGGRQRWHLPASVRQGCVRCPCTTLRTVWQGCSCDACAPGNGSNALHVNARVLRPCATGLLRTMSAAGLARLRLFRRQGAGWKRGYCLTCCASWCHPVPTCVCLFVAAGGKEQDGNEEDTYDMLRKLVQLQRMTGGQQVRTVLLRPPPCCLCTHGRRGCIALAAQRHASSGSWFVLQLTRAKCLRGAGPCCGFIKRSRTIAAVLCTAQRAALPQGEGKGSMDEQTLQPEITIQAGGGWKMHAGCVADA